MTNNIAPSSLTMAIAQVLRWTDAADPEQHAPTGAGRHAASPTRMASTHCCVAGQRRDTGVATTLYGGPDPASMHWRSVSLERCCATPRVRVPPQWLLSTRGGALGDRARCGFAGGEVTHG